MSITFSVTRELAASPFEVFRAMTNLDDAGEWMPGFVRIQHLGAPGELSVGSRWRETRRMFGKEATEEFEVTELVPPTRIGLRVDGSRGTSGSGEFLFTYSLVPTVLGTLVTLDGEIRGVGGVMGVMGRVFSGIYKRACLRDLDALGHYLKARPPVLGGDYLSPPGSSGARATVS